MVIDRFIMNRYLWSVHMVDKDDPILVDRTGTKTVATTDPDNMRVNLSSELGGEFLMTVFIHELGHCALHSYGLLERIHKMVKREYWIDMEEFICNILADYGMRIYKTAFDTFGYDAWKSIPEMFDKLAI